VVRLCGSGGQSLANEGDSLLQAKLGCVDPPKKLVPRASPRNRRLTAELYAEEGTAVLFTIRAYSGAPFSANPALCDAVTDLLASMRHEYRCWVGAYCLMPDHLHFVAGPQVDGASALTFLARFMGKSTNASWSVGRSGKLWQKRGHDHILRLAERLEDVYAYILENPVRAGLVEEPDDWPWSGILDAQE
jgi:putative transposase